MHACSVAVSSLINIFNRLWAQCTIRPNSLATLLFTVQSFESMAESKSVATVPLRGSNYPTWKLQCRMALVRDGLWNTVDGTETIPDGGNADRRAKFEARRDRALALIVLSIEPSLLYLLGEPDNPVTVWKKLSDQFQKKTWANKLSLRRRL